MWLEVREHWKTNPIQKTGSCSRLLEITVAIYRSFARTKEEGKAPRGGICDRNQNLKKRFRSIQVLFSLWCLSIQCRFNLLFLQSTWQNGLNMHQKPQEMQSPRPPGNLTNRLSQTHSDRPTGPAGGCFASCPRRVPSMGRPGPGAVSCSHGGGQHWSFQDTCALETRVIESGGAETRVVESRSGARVRGVVDPATRWAFGRMYG